MKQLRYRYKPIGSLKALARALGTSVTQLIQVAENVEVFYTANSPITKSNKKVRQTYSVSAPLDVIQDSILRKIISGVDFPEYLQGSIRDSDTPRDYVRDAEYHAGSEVLITEDISAFFSSVKASIVYKMWKYFFTFPSEVAEILTTLTTYRNFIPEGASTSSAVANLVFWDREPDLEFEFRNKGYRYSRYVDDINVSFSRRVEKQELQSVITSIYGMLASKGLKPNRDKDENGNSIKHSVRGRNRAMRIHGLNTNSGRSTLEEKERLRIRAAVLEFEKMAASTSSRNDIERSYERVNGRVNTLRRLHPAESRQYVDRLNQARRMVIGPKGSPSPEEFK